MSDPLLTLADGEQMSAAFAEWAASKGILAGVDADTCEHMARAWMAGIQWGMGFALARAAAQKAKEATGA